MWLAAGSEESGQLWVGADGLQGLTMKPLEAVLPPHPSGRSPARRGVAPKSVRVSE